MTKAHLVLIFPDLHKSEALELANGVGAEATILSVKPRPAGGYGDLGTRDVAVLVTARALRALARYLAARHPSHGDAVNVAVRIDEPGGGCHQETLSYKTAPGQSAVEAAASALRALPRVGEALDDGVW